MDITSHLEVLTDDADIEKDTKSVCCGDEVELELFDAGKLPWIDAEAPQSLAEVGRNVQTKPH